MLTVLVLAGCSVSTQYVIDKTSVVSPLPTLIKPCEKPIIWRNGSARSVERNAKIDRKNLIQCGSKFNSIIEFYRVRDEKLFGKIDNGDNN